MFTLELKSIDLFIKDLSHKTVMVSILMAILDYCEIEVNMMIEKVRIEYAKSDILQYLTLIMSMLPLVEFLIVYKPLFDIVMKVYIYLKVIERIA